MIETPALAPDVRAALPTFITIGTAKGGTTSLHLYLAEHPEIAMSSEKEPMCFERPDWVERMAEYKELFQTPAEVRGESSTAYSAYPWVPEIPDRVRSVVPDAKLIYCVRDPIERMLAHYAQMVWDRFPVRPWDELMDDLEDPMNIPVWQSRYGTQYARWAERFGQDRILVLEQNELARKREQTLRRVFEFLEVDPAFVSPKWDMNHNTARQHVRPTPLGERAGRHRGRLERVPFLRPLLLRPVKKPTLTDRQRQKVEAILKPEAERFRELTGMPFADWSV
jgi:hypothetical protein